MGRTPGHRVVWVRAEPRGGWQARAYIYIVDYLYIARANLYRGGWQARAYKLPPGSEQKMIRAGVGTEIRGACER